MRTFQQHFLNTRFSLEWLEENLAMIGCKVLKVNHFVGENGNLQTAIYQLQITTDDKGRPNFTGRQIEALLTLMQSYEEKLKEIVITYKANKTSTISKPAPYLKMGHQLTSTRTPNKGYNLYIGRYKCTRQLS